MAHTAALRCRRADRSALSCLCRALNEEILFSDSIPVLDVAVLQVRKMIRDEGYDPLVLPSVERSNSVGVQVRLHNEARNSIMW